MKPRIAIIGTGIAGLGCAHALKEHYDVTLFEKEGTAGGHSNTVSAGQVPVDTGFMVYNNTTYPRLTQLFADLGVEEQTAPMSFSLQCMQLEYCGHDLNTFFAQRKNLLSPRLYRLLFHIRRFNRQARSFLAESRTARHSLGEFLLEKNYHPDLVQLYLIPMCAAIWSSSFEDMLNYPASVLFRFLQNHGLLGFSTHLEWKTLKGGSRSYVDRLVSKIGGRLRLQTQVLAVRRGGGGVKIQAMDPDNAVYVEEFSKAILATHADQALALLEKPTDLEEDILSSFRYSRNPTYLHTDESVMPKERRAWAAWNYRLENPGLVATTHYWMNRLQALPGPTNYFVSLDGRERPEIDREKIVKKILYHHPIFDHEAIEAQRRLPLLNEAGPVYFCGSYFGYGFHEDALNSGQQAAFRALNDRVAPNSRAALDRWAEA
ncbi:MAG: FAD-dependent oxidoreductase [Bdellovibrionia bacterium]